MDQPKLKTHCGPRSFELRMDREVIARISTKLVHQQLAADTIAIRYNSQPALLAAATDVLASLDGRVHSNPALSALSKLREAIKGAGVVGMIPGVDKVAALEHNLARANRIIGWMMPHIGGMCPPDGGLGELNDHCMDNIVPEPGDETKGAPLRQRAYGAFSQ